jgi:DNA polymerase-3 subunit beta
MEITCKQSDLAKGLSIVSHAVSSRSTLPILANILLTAEQDHLKLSATNLEIGINCLIDADVIEDGSTTVPAKTFIELVNSLRQGNVELTVAEGSNDVQVKSTGSNAMIRGMDPSEFPLIPGADGGSEPVILDVKLLKDIIGQVVIATADDDARPVLTGVLVEIDGEHIQFAAADAFRLALRTASIQNANAMHSLLIPAKTLSELARILPSEGQVQMIVTPNRSQVLFHTDQIDLTSRLIEGTFPNIRAALPKEHTTRAVVETKEFAAAVKTVTPFARDSSNIARVKIGSGEGGESQTGWLTLESNAEDIGSNVSTIAANVDGPEQEIIFNVKYLSDVLAIMDTPEVALEVVSAARPGVIKPVSADDYTYVIMPMSTNR